MPAAALNARLIAPAARTWLGATRRARVLHSFARACNLINARGEVLALVRPEVGPGPFAVVVDGGADFTAWVNGGTPVVVRPGQLALGQAVIHLGSAALWNPRPRWEALQRRPALLRAQRHTLQECLRCGAPAGSLAGLFTAGGSGVPADRSFAARLAESARQPARTLIDGITAGDLALCRAGACGLAGLGAGLTPAGDDFLLGAIYAVWCIYPPQQASAISKAIAEALPLTAPLSAAWLRAAARSEAGAHWHSLVEALLGCDSMALHHAASAILQTGHTSGADALAGFVTVLVAHTGSGRYVLS